MQVVIIADSSCLILFDNIGELALLEKNYSKITITTEVLKEFGKPIPDWILVVDCKNKIYTRILESNLDSGEASAISLALETPNCLLIIDEKKGRKIAKNLSLKITGSLGVILESKNAGHIKSVREILLKLRATNFRVAVNLERNLLREANEEDIE